MEMVRARTIPRFVSFTSDDMVAISLQPPNARSTKTSA